MAIDAKTSLTNELIKNNIQVPLIDIKSYKEDKRVTVENGSGIK